MNSSSDLLKPRRHFMSIPTSSVITDSSLPTVYNKTFSNETVIIPPIFLQTTAAQTISGVFVWTALLITCHQVLSFICI